MVRMVWAARVGRASRPPPPEGGPALGVDEEDVPPPHEGGHLGPRQDREGEGPGRPLAARLPDAQQTANVEEEEGERAQEDPDGRGFHGRLFFSLGWGGD